MDQNDAHADARLNYVIQNTHVFSVTSINLKITIARNVLDQLDCLHKLIWAIIYTSETNVNLGGAISLLFCINRHLTWNQNGY